MATVTKSIGATGRDYSTLTLWEADLDNAAVYAAGDDAVGECYADAAFDESLTINGGATIGLNSVRLSVAAGHRHDGTAGTGARLVASTGNRSLVPLPPLAGTDKLIVEWLEIDANLQTYTARLISSESQGVGRVSVLRNLLVHGMRTATAGLAAIGGSAASASRDLRVQRCIVYNCGSSSADRVYTGISLDSDQATGGCLNNTVYNIFAHGAGVGRGIFINSDSANARIRNNIAVGTTGTTPVDFSFPATTVNLTSSNNLSSDSTATGAGGSGHHTSVPASNLFVSTVSGSEDLHLQTGATAIDQGVDLGTAPAGIEVDIDGRDLDAEGDVWDIGADEYVSLGPTALDVNVREHIFTETVTG